MKRNLILAFVFVLLFTQANLRADLCWVGTTGGGNGTSVFQEANWIDTATGLAPPPGSVDGNVPLANYGTIKMDGTGLTGTNTYGPYAPTFDIGLNFLDLSGGELRGSTNVGIRGTTGATGKISNDASLYVQFMLNIDLALCDSANVTFVGSGNPVNQSTIDLDSNWTGCVFFNGETVAGATGEHLSKFTVDGAAAVIGQNVDIIADGAGSKLLLINPVPEPGSLFVLTSFGIGMLVRRRR